ncbi:MAG TPA: RluA family pseudouridine synthase [Syntrophomonadaceae bacterium]|nr:RluA family pseudouridine synthase [Syntrophomonadaceae bacterium]
MLIYVVDPEDHLTYLRDVFKKKLPVSHALLARLKVQQKIRVNEQSAHTNYRLQPGDRITVDLNLDETSHILPQDIPIDIIYQDDDIMVINKPAGMAIHPIKEKMTDTLANAVTYYWSQRGESRLFRPINRLDKGTSGLVLVGKSQYAHQALFKQQKQGQVQRRYLAVVEGLVREDKGCIDLPIGFAEPSDPGFRKVDVNGKAAITHFSVIKRYPDATLLSLRLETGRTHQIRIHMSHLGHPICGDVIYGQPSPHIARQALHAGWTSFLQPRTLKRLQFEVPLPTDMQDLLAKLN